MIHLRVVEVVDEVVLSQGKTQFRFWSERMNAPVPPFVKSVHARKSRGEAPSENPKQKADDWSRGDDFIECRREVVRLRVVARVLHFEKSFKGEDVPEIAVESVFEDRPQKDSEEEEPGLVHTR